MPVVVQSEVDLSSQDLLASLEGTSWIAAISMAFQAVGTVLEQLIVGIQLAAAIIVGATEVFSMPKLSLSEDCRLVIDLRPAFGTSCALSHLIVDNEDGFGDQW